MLTIKVLNSETLLELTQLELAAEGEYFVGRATNCRLVLPSPSVSRLHGRILLQAEAVQFTDFASKTGSRLNNVELKANQPYPLAAGDILRIGEFVLMIESNSNLPSTSLTLDNTLSRLPQALTSTQSDPLPVHLYMPVAALPDPDQQPRWTGHDQTVECVQVIVETPRIQTYRFVADPPVLFSFQPGQAVSLSLDNSSHTYYLTSSPSRPHLLEISADRIEQPWLAGVSPGTRIRLQSLVGQSLLWTQPAPKLLLIGIDHGMVALISMLRWIYDTAAECDLVCLGQSVGSHPLPFQAELSWMAARHAHFQLVMSRSQSQPGQPWTGLTLPLSKPLLQLTVPDCTERTIYASGSGSELSNLKAMMLELNMPMHKYFELAACP